MTVMAAAFPSASISASTVRLWQAELGGLPADVLEKAARVVIRSESFFPSLPQFTQIIMRLLGGELRTGESAWNDVELARSRPPGQRMDGMDPAVADLVRYMDYSPLDMSADSYRLGSIKKTFLALWAERRQKALDGALSGPVVLRPQMPMAAERPQLNETSITNKEINP